MPEVRRGSLQGISDPSLLQHVDSHATRHSSRSRSRHQHPEQTPTSPASPVTPTAPRAHFDANPVADGHDPSASRDSNLNSPPRRNSRGPATRLSLDPDNPDNGRRSLSYALRPEAEAYYDSRAGTHREWVRRGKTLQEYYDNNPELLPQLPFTWHHGKKRWRLFLFAFLVFVDASAVPIALYYGMSYAGDVPGWIIFAVVTTIWGGPTYLEFGIRTLRLIKKERFYRPLGTDSRWCFDMLTWASVLTITVVTALFVIGSAPHIVWLRVLCMPAPAILWCLGGVLAFLQLYHNMGWPAPFRISSTPKGGKVLPGAYYFIEDVAAVNAGAGRPFREALAARYQASPRFRRMLYVQSIFWSIPSLILAIPLTVIAVIPPVPATGAYGVCWAVPFLWCTIWGIITIRWCKKDMVRERLEWQAGVGPVKASTSSPRSEAPSTSEGPSASDAHVTTGETRSAGHDDTPVAAGSASDKDAGTK